MTVLYPDGYGTRMVTIDQMRARHQAKMHPEFARRFFSYIIHKEGKLGVGGGWRDGGAQPSGPTFAPEGKSFHQYQRFASGVVGYAAIDLVTTDGPDASNEHDSITWAMTSDAPLFGLHTFIKSPIEEPWHIQPVEIRGWQSWVDAGRKDPNPAFALPGAPLPQPNPVPPTGPPYLPTGVPDVFYAIEPYRNSDTRGFGGAGVPPNTTHVFGLNPDKIPLDAIAVAVNVVAIAQPSAQPGFVTVWPGGPRPNTSCVNFNNDGKAYNGAATIGIRDNSISIFTSQQAHLIVDVTGYWRA